MQVSISHYITTRFFVAGKKEKRVDEGSSATRRETSPSNADRRGNKGTKKARSPSRQGSHSSVTGKLADHENDQKKHKQGMHIFSFILFHRIREIKICTIRWLGS